MPARVTLAPNAAALGAQVVAVALVAANQCRRAMCIALKRAVSKRLIGVKQEDCTWAAACCYCASHVTHVTHVTRLTRHTSHTSHVTHVTRLTRHAAIASSCGSAARRVPKCLQCIASAMRLHARNNVCAVVKNICVSWTIRARENCEDARASAHLCTATHRHA